VHTRRNGHARFVEILTRCDVAHLDQADLVGASAQVVARPCIAAGSRGNGGPVLAAEADRMPTLPVVRRRDDAAVGLDQPAHRRCREPGEVDERDDRRIDRDSLQRGKPRAQR